MKDTLVNLKPTTPYYMKYDRTPNSGFYVNTRMMKSTATEYNIEKPDDYIMEDPSRMTGRGTEESFILPTTAKSLEYSKISRHKCLTSTLGIKPAAAPTTRKKGPSRPNSRHNTFNKGHITTEGSSLISKPSEKTVEEDTLPWSKDFNHKFWSNWDEPEYVDYVPDSQDIYGMKKL